jgi:hypothetical protein
MANRQHSLLAGYPLSDAELSKIKGDGVLRRFLEQYATRDRVTFFDDFVGDTINLDNYAVASSAGTGSAVFATAVAANGTIQADTGTDDNGSVSLVGPAIWKGDLNCGLEIRVKSDAVTSYNLEVGFIDAVPAANASGVSDADTPAAAFTDGALFQIDTDQTLVTLSFVTDGTALAVQSTTLPAGQTLLVAATYTTFRIQLVGNDVFAWRDGVLVASHVAAVEGGTALAPWVYIRTRTTAARFPDVDYLRLWADRV